MVRFAVVGVGYQGQIHAEVCTRIPGAELRAVCDTDEGLAKRVATKFNVNWYTNYQELLKQKEIDALILAVPHHLHARFAVEAAEAGKHVAMEKPLCLTLAQADDMISAVKKAGVLDLYCENVSFAPAYTMAKDIIDSGGVGDVYTLRGSESGYYPKDVEGGIIGWRTDLEKWGGDFLDDGVHPLGAIRYLLDRDPAIRVYAEMTMNGISPW